MKKNKFTCLFISAMILAFVFAACDNETNINYFTVSFETNGGSPVPADQTVKQGDKVLEPNRPVRDDYYYFIAWFTDADTFLYRWNFTEYTVNDNITLYANWTRTAGTVTFESNGGTPIASQVIGFGGTVREPLPEPTREGSSFLGWFYYDDDAGQENRWDFAVNTVSGDITLYANWTLTNPTYYTVTFDSNGGSPIASQKVKQGEFVVNPGVPERTDGEWYFIGWFYYYDGEEYMWHFARNTVDSDITIVALWGSP